MRVEVPGERPTPTAPAVRPMREADLEEVLGIERRSFPTPWTEQTFRGLLRRQNTALLVADVGGRIAGYAVLWFAADEGELGDMAVRPELRRRGIGGFLLGAAIREAGRRGIRTLFLEVRRSNRQARTLYERAGFEVAGIRRGYYTSPREDALVMQRSVDDAAR